MTEQIENAFPLSASTPRESGARDPFIPSGRRRALVFVVVALLLSITVIQAWIRASHSNADWIVYWTAATQFQQSGDPYNVRGSSNDYYIYPPLFALLLRPLGALRAENAVVVWDVLGILMLFGCYFEWRRIYSAMRSDRPPMWLFLAAVYVTADPVIATLQGGQANIPNLYLTLLGIRLVLVSDQTWLWIAGGLVLALPAAIKLSPGLVGAVLVVQLLAARPGGAVADARKRGAALALGLGVGATLWLLAIPSLIVGWHRNIEFLGSFFDHVVFSRVNMHWLSKTNQGIVRVVAQWALVAGGWLNVEIGRRIVVAVTTVVALAYGIPVLYAMQRLVRRGRLLDHVVVCGLAAAASLFYSPLAWHHHYVMAMPFIASAPLWLIDAGRQRAAQWLTAGTMGAFLLQSLLAEMHFAAAPTLAPCFALCVVTFAVIVARPTRSEFTR